MFPYQPTPNLVPQIIMDAQQQADQSITRGIDAASQGFSQGIDRFNQLNLQKQQVKGAIAGFKPAVDAGLIDQGTLDHISSLDPWQAVGAITTLHTILPTIMRNSYYQGRNGIGQQNADFRAAGGNNQGNPTTTF